jgi:protein-tyrosine phosphatase
LCAIFTEWSPDFALIARNIGSMSFTELHFHILPGIDDGPGTMEESVALACAAAAEGTRVIVATPHVHEHFVTDVSVLQNRVRKVNDALGRARVPIRVLCGGELAHGMVARLGPADLDVIAHGPKGRRWLLLEAPLERIEDGFAPAAAELRERGFGIVIAPPSEPCQAPTGPGVPSSTSSQQAAHSRSTPGPWPVSTAIRCRGSR